MNYTGQEWIAGGGGGAGSGQPSIYNAHGQMPHDDVPITAIPDGGFAHLSSVPTDPTGPFGVCALAFDDYEELLWTGNTNGHVSSYYSAAQQKYTGFQVVPTKYNNDPLCAVASVKTTDSAVLALSKKQIRVQTRTGLPKHTFANDQLSDMSTMLIEGGSALIGGAQPNLLQIDVTTGQIRRSVPHGRSDCVILRRNDHFYFCGESTGSITLRSQDSLQTVHTFDAHSGALADMAVKGPVLVSCGYGNRGYLTPDRFMMIYDLRMMRAQPPLQVPFEPAFVRFLPTYSDRRLVAASQAGDFQVFEMGELGMPYQVATGGMPIMSMETCNSKQAIAFADAAGVVHLFSDRPDPVFNFDSRESVFADQSPMPPPMSVDDVLAPLAVIPTPFPVDGQYFSDWPAALCKIVYRQPEPISADVLSSMRLVQFVGHAANKHNQLPNQCPYDLSVPPPSAHKHQTHTTTHKSPAGRASDHESRVPKMYRRVHMWCRQDTAYEQYNKTGYSAIEAHSINAYVAAVLIVLYHTKEIRSAVVSHLCRKEHCLPCELAFLFQNLTDAHGQQPCLATNLLRAFRTKQQAEALGLVLSDANDQHRRKQELMNLVQSFARFILQQLIMELNEQPARISGSTDKEGENKDIPETEIKLIPSESAERVRKVFAADVQTTVICACNKQSEHDTQPFVLTLNYPNEPSTSVPFTSILSNSLCAGQSMVSYCHSCTTYASVTQTKQVRTLPYIMAIDTHIVTDKDTIFWKYQFATTECPPVGDSAIGKAPTFKQYCHFADNCNRADCKYLHANSDDDNGIVPEHAHWLPVTFFAGIDSDGKVIIQDECSATARIEYNVNAVVYMIKDESEPHLVTFVRVDNTWLLYNDVIVQRVTVDQVLHFDTNWKWPCLIYYKQTAQLNALKEENACLKLDESVFALDECLSVRRRLSSSPFVPLTEKELPKEGDLVALDAEFVSLNQEDTNDARSDTSSKSMTPPKNSGNSNTSSMTVARVTCVRGYGEQKGVSFMDDYITSQDEVTDYLTKFSGIRADDLNPSVSTKHLTTIKSVHLKLRYLINRRVVFVGHGLRNDFRMLNLYVSKDQIRDTVELYHIPRNRMVSLRFLAWHFLGIRIQEHTHDSAEDARTALQLYEKYEELIKNGEESFKQKLDDMYNIGRQLQWCVPEETIDNNDNDNTNHTDMANNKHNE